MKVSFVIPAYNHFELTNQLLLDIYNYCPSVDEVLILDNGSEANGIKNLVLETWRASHFPLRYVGVENNVGFVNICNWGVPQAEHEAVVLISNDVRIESDLVNEVRQKLKQNIILGGVLYRESTGWNEFEGTIYPYLEGWLLAFTKWAWEDLQGFDEDFAPFDFEDVSLSTAAIQKGYELIQLEGTYRHMSAQTIGYNPERLAITERNRERFRQKWVK